MFNGLEFSLKFHCLDRLADLFDVDTLVVKGVGIEFVGMVLCSSTQMKKICFSWICFY